MAPNEQQLPQFQRQKAPTIPSSTLGKQTTEVFWNNYIHVSHLLSFKCQLNEDLL